jgi:hypothetical protein
MEIEKACERTSKQAHARCCVDGDSLVIREDHEGWGGRKVAHCRRRKYVMKIPRVDMRRFRCVIVEIKQEKKGDRAVGVASGTWRARTVG